MKLMRCYRLVACCTASLFLSLVAGACSSETDGTGDRDRSQENASGETVKEEAVTPFPDAASARPDRDAARADDASSEVADGSAALPVSDAGTDEPDASQGDGQPPSGKVCGSRGLPAACGGKSFCDYATGTLCGAADQGGVCKPRPDVCTQVYEPVCGCDGKTYGNGCMANNAGVSVRSDGACADEPAEPGKTCGGLAGGDCGLGAFCDYGDGQGCGHSLDTPGQCVAAPKGCTKEHQPVCGCDHHGYGNACEAHRNGVGVLHDGYCTELDCQHAGGEVVFGIGPAPKCDKKAFNTGPVTLTSGALPIEGAICCIPAP